MVNNKNFVISELLSNLEEELKSLSLWSNSFLTDEQLASTAPFGCDVMDFHQWLQHIFINKMNIIIKSNSELPRNMAIAPMAEYLYKEEVHKYRKLIGILRKLDRVVTE